MGNRILFSVRPGRLLRFTTGHEGKPLVYRLGCDVQHSIEHSRIRSGYFFLFLEPVLKCIYSLLSPLDGGNMLALLLLKVHWDVGHGKSLKIIWVQHISILCIVALDSNHISSHKAIICEIITFIVYCPPPFLFLTNCTCVPFQVFFVLRKKNSQVTFLHVYHHSIMPFTWWFGVRFAAGRISYFFFFFFFK